MTRRPQWLWRWALLALFAMNGCIVGRSEPGRAETYTEVVQYTDAGDIPHVRAALEAHPAWLESTEWGGATLLQNAVDHDRVAMAAFLLEKGARVDVRKSNGMTALHKAAQNGNVEMIRLLLEHRAAINPRDGNGWTPLDRALKWRHPEAAAYLRRKGGQSGGDASVQ